MAKRGGFPGGGMPGNMANLMKQAQKMQRQMEEATKELEEKTYSAKAGGGAVEVVVSGKREMLKITISEEVVDPDDIETLQDIIMAATNEALRQAEEANNELIGKMTGGIVSQYMVDGIVKMVNGRFFAGAGQVISGFFKQRKVLKKANTIK